MQVPAYIILRDCFCQSVLALYSHIINLYNHTYALMAVAIALGNNYNMHMKKAAVIILTLGIFLFSACSGGLEQSESYALNTICTQTVYGGKARQAIEDVSALLTDITNTMSVNEGSEVYAVNEAAPNTVRVSQQTADVISAALKIAGETDGAFDPAIGPVTALWDITGDPRVPERAEIEGVLELTGYKGVEVDGTNVSLKKSGMRIDLGGIAKGYAADKAVEIYKSYGVNSALLDLGGNIYAYGKRPDGGDYRIGIRDPLGEAGETAAVLSVSDTSVVTSGVYERFFVSGGVRYHHIFDPKTGYPADNGLVSVTVICKSSTRADGLSTALFVMGLNEGLKFASAQYDIQAVFITEDRDIYVTEGLKESVEITNEAYTLKS